MDLRQIAAFRGYLELRKIEAVQATGGHTMRVVGIILGARVR
jgi:hypothetical protein